MIKKNFVIFLVINLASFSSVFGQFSESYFSDNEIKEGGGIGPFVKGDNSIYIGGRSFDNYKGEPFVMKLDTLGEVIWSTTSLDTLEYNCSAEYISDLFLSGEYVYAISLVQVASYKPKYLWKINANTGDIIWKELFYSDYFKAPNHFLDYDSSKFLVGYYESSGNAKFAFISKVYGDTISTHKIGSGYNVEFGLVHNSELDIYYSYRDSVYKASHSNPDSIIWRNALPASEFMNDYLEIHVDDNDSVFLFGRFDPFYSSNGKGKIAAVNSQDGNLIWVSNAPGDEVREVNYIDANGFIFSTWRHAFVGGGQYNYWTSKIDKLTGNEDWSSNYNFGNGGEAALSLDKDGNGDLFLTGYFGDANYGPEDWGVLKLDGATGNNLYSLNISLDNQANDDLSIGIGVAIFNDKPYFVGNLETTNINGTRRTKITFVELENSSGNIQQLKYVGGDYQFRSRAIQIENLGAEKTVVFKQVGRSVSVEMYDFNKNLIWEKSILKDYILNGSDIIINDSSKIIVSAYSTKDTCADPFFSAISDSVFLFYLDTLGNINEEFSFHLGTSNTQPIEILDDGRNSFIFYHKNNSTFYRKIDSNGVSLEYGLDIPYYNKLSRNKTTIDYSDSILYSFGYKNYNTRLIEINKNTLDTLSLGVIPFIKNVNYVSRIDLNNILISGKDYLNSDIIVSYNTSILDTNWTKTYSIQSEIYKTILNDDMSELYAIGLQSVDVVLRKLNPINGDLIWSYYHSGTASQIDEPSDVVYDKYRGQIVLTGYQSDNNGIDADRNVFVEVVDTNGINVSSIIKTGDFTGDNIGYCAQVIQDGSVWVGGSRNDSVFGKAGFVFEIDTTLLFSSIEEVSDELRSGLFGFNVHPNPFSDIIYLNYEVLTANSSVNILIHDLTGRLVYSGAIQHQVKGKYIYSVNTGDLSGMYIIQLRINDSVYSARIVGK